MQTSSQTNPLKDIGKTESFSKMFFQILLRVSATTLNYLDYTFSGDSVWLLVVSAIGEIYVTVEKDLLQLY